MRTDDGDEPGPWIAGQRRGPGGIHLAGAEGHPGLSLQIVTRRTERGQSRRPHLPTIRHRLSEERLRSYDRAAGGYPTGSLQLYEWNIALSAAFFESLHVLEVVLRNAFHEQLVAWHLDRGQAWIVQASRVPELLATRPRGGGSG